MSMPPDSLTTTLQELIPKSLDDIIRANRDQCRLALATDTELAELAELATEIPEGPVRHTLTAWQIIVVHLGGEQATNVALLIGTVTGSGESWLTSRVLGVDLDRGLVRTANSLYRVQGSRGTEADLDLIHVCATLNIWGLGPYFAVPEFFY